MSESCRIPRHVAIIMDGNGRWAQMRGKERLYGHMQGVESVRNVIKAARSHGVGYLTLYVFSTENWGRPREEVDGLMEILCGSIVREMDALVENGARIRIIGDREAMSEKVQRHLTLIEEGTAQCSQLTVALALNYGAREEIAAAVREIAREVEKGGLAPEQIMAENIAAHLYTKDMPDPDLLIRTSGEVRLSNFLLWQTAYTELYFTDTLWPDFSEKDFAVALEEYARRDRRYGLVAKQNS